eukprot:evm.model.scf_511.2 EVM.evm.TU.scf_511.2   scf_511:53252-64416(-)
MGIEVVRDLRGRLPWYGDDWREGLNSGVRIVAPSFYIFFASAIPALAFGEQIDHDTDGAMNGVHVLTATALCGIIQAIFGGQPLLIVGVAEPIILVYTFMFEFLDDRNKKDQFVAWAAWVNVWAALFIFVLAMAGACKFIDKFTRFSGELFGMLIALLFLQQAIKGLTEEFKRDDEVEEGGSRKLLSGGDALANTYPWRLVNGIWGVVLAIGLLLTSLLVHGARSWRYGKGWTRSLLADYGVPLMVVVWSGISYSISGAPNGVPSRLSIPNTWDVKDTWKVVQDMGDVQGWLIGAAAIPGFIITALFYFDHNVSSQLAQQKEFALKKPSAYNYDFLLLAFMTLMCGLLGIPPVNGVLPQAPMHTKSLATLKKQLKKRDARRELIRNSQAHSNDLNKGSLTKSSTGSFKHMSTGAAQSPVSPSVGLARMSAGHVREGSVGGGIPKVSSATSLSDAAKMKQSASHQSLVSLSNGESGLRQDFVTLEVKEQRLSGLLQAVLVAVCLALTPVIQRIPKSVLWGYFAYMAFESLPGSEFWERILLLFTDPKKRYQLLETTHAPYLETVPFHVISKFTIFQAGFMLFVYAITWAGVAGVAFPLAIMALIPFRQHVMPKLFSSEHLRELDMAEYEEAPPVDHREVLREMKKKGVILEADEEEERRQALEREVVGDMMPQVKHHLSRSELERRKKRMEIPDSGQQPTGLRHRKKEASDPSSPVSGGAEGDENRV